MLSERAFVLRFFGDNGDDRLLVVNLGYDLYLDVAPEPLLARWLKLVKEKLPFLGLSTALCVITIWAQHKGGAIKSLDSSPLSFRFCVRTSGTSA